MRYCSLAKSDGAIWGIAEAIATVGDALATAKIAGKTDRLSARIAQIPQSQGSGNHAPMLHIASNSTPS